ncbi:MAG TPA: TerB family tellurite resistance protein [Candidatus Nanopelagicales bacterium]|nr:TerB family tellurite resistance protein [Candidatus Nanopelagicales bacterium]
MDEIVPNTAAPAQDGRFQRTPRRDFDGDARFERRQSLEALSQGVDEDDGPGSPWPARQAAWRRRGDAALPAEERVAADILSAILGATLLVATAGGEIARAERREIVDSLAQAVGGALDEAVVEEGVAAWIEALERGGAVACLERLGAALGGRDARYEAFQIAAGVALVDGDLSAAESAALDALAQAIGLSASEADQLFEGVNEYMG